MQKRLLCKHKLKSKTVYTEAQKEKIKSIILGVIPAAFKVKDIN
jgi:hypothetical protein